MIDQNYGNKEIIVIDGGSTDNSVDIIKKYQDNIAYWISEKDKGTYDANNKGLSKMTGDYWCILNSDDLLLPGALEIVADAIIKSPTEKWLSGEENIIDEGDNINGEVIPQAPEPLEGYTFLEACWISHSSTFLNKDVIKSVGLFEKWHVMDYNYWLRMEDKGFFPLIIDKKISALRIHSDCKSYDQISLYQEALNMRLEFCKQKNLLNSPQVKKKIKSEEVHVIRLRIAEALMHHQKAKAFDWLIRFIKKYPSSIKQRWFWGMVRRIMSGLKKSDPIFESMPAKKGTASWNYK